MKCFHDRAHIDHNTMHKKWFFHSNKLYSSHNYSWHIRLQLTPPQQFTYAEIK